jgi:hypothetical protein
MLSWTQDKASGAAVQLKGMEQQLDSARGEAAKLREGRLQAEAAHNKERLEQAGLLVGAGGVWGAGLVGWQVLTGCWWGVAGTLGG